MRASFSLKLISLIFLGVLTSFVTSRFVGQKRARAQAQPALAFPQGSAVVTDNGVNVVEDPAAIDAHMRIPLSNKIISCLNIYRLDGQVNGNKVTVSASTLIREQRRGFNFVWALRAIDMQDRLVDMIVYDTQVFSMPEGVIDIWPTFNEVVTLPAGSYNLQLVLYIIPLDFDATKLKTDPALEAQHREATATKQVTITD